MYGFNRQVHSKHLSLRSTRQIGLLQELQENEANPRNKQLQQSKGKPLFQLCESDDSIKTASKALWNPKEELVASKRL